MRNGSIFTWAEDERPILPDCYGGENVGHVLSDVPERSIRSGLQVLEDLGVLRVVGVQHVGTRGFGSRTEDMRRCVAILESPPGGQALAVGIAGAREVHPVRRHL